MIKCLKKCRFDGALYALLKELYSVSLVYALKLLIQLTWRSGKVTFSFLAWKVLILVCLVF